MLLGRLKCDIMDIIQRRYPIGIQTFSEIREGNYVYDDKTDLVWKLANSVKYVFLSRPRRFGKSLLSTTLKSYFEGRRDLFEGLKIMEYEKEWKGYPVIHLDLSTAKDMGNAAKLRSGLKDVLEDYCAEYEVNVKSRTPGQCLKRIILSANKKHESKVVVLIDEYDAPLLDVLHDNDRLEDMRSVMREFFQPLKACEGSIRFCFLTGITKFSQLSIFSTLNNISDMSMDDEYATICGITENELVTALREDAEMLAKEYECTFEEMRSRLKQHYDGYHFSKKSDEVYNPYSLMNCFAKKEIRSFWFESATPTFLFRQMQRFGTDITGLDSIEAPETEFNLPTENLNNALPLLYQTGYLTIKDYDAFSKMYKLGIPNQEVRVGLTCGLISMYTGVNSGNVQAGCAYKMYKSLISGDIDQALRELKAFLAGVPYVEGFKKKLTEAAAREGFYEYTFYLILSMLNVYVRTQVKCWTGRTDMIVFAPETIYVFEFKVGDTAEAALKQIDESGYAEQFATDGRNVVKVGVSFDIDTWTINEWMVN